MDDFSFGHSVERGQTTYTDLLDFWLSGDRERKIRRAIITAGKKQPARRVTKGA